VKRGDVVTVAAQGDFGKPRPALVIQADLFGEHTSVTILPVTSTLVAAPLLRVSVKPEPGNGLRKPSQIMVDKAVTLMRAKIGPPIGHMDSATLLEVDRRLTVFLGIAR
jgi:mRNA interferase MazF